MNITEFLLARITEDESRAWSELGAEYFADGAWPEECAKRVLAECAAKRAIMRRHRRVADLYDDELGDTCTACFSSGPDAQSFPCATVRALAAVYADHPDYHLDWAL